MLCTILIAAVAAAGGYLGGRAAFDAKHHDVAGPGAPSALAQLQAGASVVPTGTATGATPLPDRVRAALASALSDPALGPSLQADVEDAASGSTLYSNDVQSPAAPASTAKLMTAVAILTVHKPTDRITTTVVQGSAPGQVVLVGAGDPTLTAAANADGSYYTDPALMSVLAAGVKRAGVAVTQVTVDDSLFAQPAISPDWDAEDVPSNYGGAITAFMADGARSTPTAANRSATPDTDAAHEFAALVGAPGASVDTGTAPAGAKVLGSVESATYAELVSDMLQESDNVIAECLARLVAVAEKGQASFTGAAAAVAKVLGTLGISTSGMRDGSGLAAADRVTPAVLTGVLALIAGSSHENLRPIVAALPVAAWSGTLADRYLSGSGADGAAGDARAKTGTLTGVSTLAGFVHDSSGRVLLFVLMAGQAPDAEAAEPALDRVVAALASCGCS